MLQKGGNKILCAKLSQEATILFQNLNCRRRRFCPKERTSTYFTTDISRTECTHTLYFIATVVYNNSSIYIYIYIKKKEFMLKKSQSHRHRLQRFPFRSRSLCSRPRKRRLPIIFLFQPRSIFKPFLLLFLRNRFF